MYYEDGLTARDGKGVFVHRWLPDGPVEGVVMVAHGISEHGKRYDALAEYLNMAGYAVYANDHRAHGRTAGDRLGEDDAPDIFLALVEDLQSLNEKIRAAHPDVPVFLLGHSMGSFATLKYLSLYSAHVDAVILSGSNGPENPALIRSLMEMARTSVRLRGRHSPGKAITNTMFSTYNRPFRPARTSFDWLSRDTEAVDRYIFDAFCGEPVSNAFYASFFHHLVLIYGKESLGAIRSDLPVLLLAGTKDSVGRMGDGVLKLAHLLEKRGGLVHLYLRFYKEARHEILNEVNRLEVFEDVKGFLNGVRRGTLG